MRGRVAMLAALLLSSATSFTVGRGAEPIDWVLATMSVAPATGKTLGPGGSGSGSGGISLGGESASMEIGGAGHSTGTGPLILGFAFGGVGPAFVPVTDVGNGGIRLRTTSDLGELDVEVTPVGEEEFLFGIATSVVGGGPGEKVATLVFAANGVIDSYDVNGAGGVTPPTVTVGSGSTAIYVAGPGTTGVAADAAIVVAGASGASVTTTNGIVGGAVLETCTRCTIEWTAPDGEQGTLEATNVFPHGVPRPPVPIPIGLGDFPEGFSGPAGEWAWAWTGAGVRLDPSTAVVGAFAPIGADWALFRGEPVVGPPPTGSPSPSPTVLGGKRTRSALAGTGVTPAWWGAALIVLAFLSYRRLRSTN